MSIAGENATGPLRGRRITLEQGDCYRDKGNKRERGKKDLQLKPRRTIKIALDTSGLN